MTNTAPDPLRAWLDATSPDPFILEGKALGVDVAQLASGDLLVKGIAAVWDVDRVGDRFDTKAFDASIPAFINGPAPLLLQHVKNGRQLGRVLSLEAKPDGLHMTARVDGALRTDPSLSSVYHQVKNGSLRGVSVGGYFTRRGGKIVRADLVEVSLTPVPVGGNKATISVVSESKALGSPLSPRDREDLVRLRVDIERLRADVARDRLRQLSERT